MSEKLAEAMVNMQEQKVLEIAKQLVDDDEDPEKILDACSKAMETVGTRFENGEYFLPQLMMAGEMLRQVSEMIKPKLKGVVRSERKGKVLIGTVKGDLHDIGKDIVTFMLDVNGFEVRDLGIDVPPEEFVNAVRDFQPQVVALSGFLTLAFDSMKVTVEAITEAGFRNNVKIMIGGGQIDEEIMKYTGADGYGLNAMEGVSLSRAWVGGE